MDESITSDLYNRRIVKSGGMSFASIDIVLNNFSKTEILTQLEKLIKRKDIRVMIHEQYFYADYKRYQPDFEEKLAATFSFLKSNGYKSVYFEDLI